MYIEMDLTFVIAVCMSTYSQKHVGMHTVHFQTIFFKWQPKASTLGCEAKLNNYVKIILWATTF